MLNHTENQAIRIKTNCGNLTYLQTGKSDKSDDAKNRGNIKTRTHIVGARMCTVRATLNNDWTRSCRLKKYTPAIISFSGIYSGTCTQGDT